MRPPLRNAFVALLAAASLSTCATMSTADNDYSRRLDASWDFDRPGDSEARFRAEAARQRPGSRETAEANTQVARALGLQRRFEAADRTQANTANSTTIGPGAIFGNRLRMSIATAAAEKLPIKKLLRETRSTIKSPAIAPTIGEKL